MKPAGLKSLEQDAAAKRLDWAECAACRIDELTPGGPDCTGCRVGAISRYLREVLSEKFHLEFQTNRWHGQCGHSWERESAEVPTQCPWCALKAENELLRKVVEEREEMDTEPFVRMEGRNRRVYRLVPIDEAGENASRQSEKE